MRGSFGSPDAGFNCYGWSGNNERHLSACRIRSSRRGYSPRQWVGNSIGISICTIPALAAIHPKRPFPSGSKGPVSALNRETSRQVN